MLYIVRITNLFVFVVHLSLQLFQLRCILCFKLLAFVLDASLETLAQTLQLLTVLGLQLGLCYQVVAFSLNTQ